MASIDATHEEHDVIVDEDTPDQPISIADSSDAGEGGKLKMIVQLVKKCLGVKDIAAMCVQPRSKHTELILFIGGFPYQPHYWSRYPT